MSDQVARQKRQIDRTTIVKKSFYVEAFSDNYYQEGALRLYRVTKASTAPPKTSFAYQSVRIRNPEEFTNVKLALDWLAGKLKWQELPPLLEDFRKQIEKEKEVVSPEILRLVRQYPEASIAILRAFDTVFGGHIEVEDFPTIKKFIETALKSLAGQARNMTEIKINLFEQLNKETSPEGIKKLTKLLEEYDLPQLTSVASIITDRLQRLRFLEKTIQSDKAYELKGKDSVHNQLSNALWILNDSYWLLHSNESLKHFLDTESNPTEIEGLRPDFICANDAHTLVIVEIKRPSHEVSIKDINQLQSYLVTVDEYKKDFITKQGFIIAKNISARLQKIVEDTKRIQFKSYIQLIDECKRRYQEYLDAIEKQ